MDLNPVSLFAVFLGWNPFHDFQFRGSNLSGDPSSTGKQVSLAPPQQKSTNHVFVFRHNPSPGLLALGSKWHGFFSILLRFFLQQKDVPRSCFRQCLFRPLEEWTKNNSQAWHFRYAGALQIEVEDSTTTVCWSSFFYRRYRMNMALLFLLAHPENSEFGHKFVGIRFSFFWGVDFPPGPRNHRPFCRHCCVPALQVVRCWQLCLRVGN